MRIGVRVALCFVQLGACADGSGSGAGLDAGVVIERDAASAEGGARDAGLADELSCAVEPPRACVEPAPTYGDVSPIFRDRCVICHAGMAGGPWPLTSYGHVADWQNEIRTHVSRCTMPPPDSGVAISDEERAEILMWLRCGLAR